MDRTHKGGIKGYWKRRGYYHLDAAAAQRRPPLPTAELGGGAPAQEGPGRRRRNGWRVRRGLGRRVLRALSPRGWLVRLRDAYISAMLRLASSPAVGYGAGAPYCATTTHGVFARPPQLKEYDEKVLVDIYRSMLARGGPLAVAGDGVSASATSAAALRLSTAV